MAGPARRKLQDHAVANEYGRHAASSEGEHANISEGGETPSTTTINNSQSEEAQKATRSAPARQCRRPRTQHAISDQENGRTHSQRNPPIDKGADAASASYETNCVFLEQIPL